MTHTTLVDPLTLSVHLNDPNWIIVDTRFDLADPAKGEQQYAAAHIPGARYAHLDRDLSGQKSGSNGRHPLPTPEQMRTTFGSMGITRESQVIVYDADSSMYAARLWWMLRFMSHDAVAVLDGGFARWVNEGYATTHLVPAVEAVLFDGEPREDWRLDVSAVVAGLGDPSRVLVDARAEGRFRGEGETLDKVAGHIPGATNHFFQKSLTDAKTFKSSDELRAQWQALLGAQAASNVVMYCGSGVTACHNLLSLEHAGLAGARLFPGSWSEWSADPARPVETGPG